MCLFPMQDAFFHPRITVVVVVVFLVVVIVAVGLEVGKDTGKKQINRLYYLLQYVWHDTTRCI